MVSKGRGVVCVKSGVRRLRWVHRTRQAGPAWHRRGTFIVPVRRGVLVTPAEFAWIIKRCAADATSASLRRGNSEGRACHARRIRMDYQTLRRGRDERVPPRGGPDKRVPPKAKSERHARERFRSKPRASSRNDRTQAEIVISRKQGAADKALVSSAHQKSGSSPPRGPAVTEPRGL